MHEVHLCGLEPGTTYYYQGRRRLAGGLGRNAVLHHGAVESGKITVGILGDARDDVGVWQRVQLRHA